MLYNPQPSTSCSLGYPTLALSWVASASIMFDRLALLSIYDAVTIKCIKERE